MSVDICFWKSGSESHRELYEGACEGDFALFVQSQDVLDFRSELLDRWPDLGDSIEPLEYDPDLDEQEDLSRYVLLTVHVDHTDTLPAIIELAVAHNLVGFDPQSNELIRHA